jgi:hypothetical protein
VKKCTYCGKKYPDEATVCPVDQQPLTSDGSALTQAVAPSKQPVAGPAVHPVKPALMTRLRSLHLYLGCIFAPMLLLFAFTGIWQTLGIRGTKVMSMLSSIHTSHGMKGGTTLTGPLMRCFVVFMAIAFVITTILGILMAVNYGRNRRAAYYCLVFGIVFPLALILIRLAG